MQIFFTDAIVKQISGGAPIRHGAATTTQQTPTQHQQPPTEKELISVVSKRKPQPHIAPKCGQRQEDTKKRGGQGKPENRHNKTKAHTVATSLSLNAHETYESENETTTPPHVFCFWDPVYAVVSTTWLSCDMLFSNALTRHNSWLTVCARENSRSVAFAHSLM